VRILDALRERGDNDGEDGPLDARLRILYGGLGSLDTLLQTRERVFRSGLGTASLANIAERGLRGLGERRVVLPPVLKRRAPGLGVRLAGHAGALKRRFDGRNRGECSVQWLLCGRHSPVGCDKARSGVT
jgi:hypothetical protein